jgi:hypothetical protein
LIVVLMVVGLLGSVALASGRVLPRAGEIFDATATSGHGEEAVLNQQPSGWRWRPTMAAGRP